MKKVSFLRPGLFLNDLQIDENACF